MLLFSHSYLGANLSLALGGDNVDKAYGIIMCISSQYREILLCVDSVDSGLHIINRSSFKKFTGLLDMIGEMHFLATVTAIEMITQDVSLKPLGII